MTITDALERIGDLERLADKTLDMAAHEVFIDPPEDYSDILDSADRMLEIAPLLSDSPYELVDRILTELSYEQRFVTDGNEESEKEFPWRDYLRPAAFDIAFGVAEETTWEQFAAIVREKLQEEHAQAILETSTDLGVQLLASGAVNEHSSFADLGKAVRQFYSVAPENAPQRH